MNSDLLLTIIKDIVVPELSSFIASHYNKTGELPTQEELKKAIDDLTAKIVMKSESFIDELQKKALDGSVY